MIEGRKHRGDHDLKGALESFQGADAIMHAPTSGLEVARAQVDLGLLLEARDALLRVLRIEVPPGNKPFAEAHAKADALNNELEPRIPSLLVHVKGLPADATPTIELDGVAVPTAAQHLPRRLNPGHHVVTASAGTAHARGEAQLEEGKAAEITLTMVITGGPPPKAAATPVLPNAIAGAAHAPSAEAATVAPAKTGGLRPITWVAFGVAGAGVVVGSVTGLMSIADKSAAQSGCTSNNQCPPATHADIESARSLAAISTIAFIVAGASGAAGVVSLFIARPAPQTAGTNSASLTPWIGFGSAGLAGSF